jgi:hypothetical protein
MATPQRTVLVAILTATALLFSYDDAAAQSRRRARLSEDLQPLPLPIASMHLHLTALTVRD